MEVLLVLPLRSSGPSVCREIKTKLCAEVEGYQESAYAHDVAQGRRSATKALLSEATKCGAWPEAVSILKQ